MPSNQKCPQGCACKKHGRSAYAGKPVQTPEEKRAYQRQYRAANCDKISAQQRARYEARGDVIRETKARYREANRDKIRAYGRDYQRSRDPVKRHGLSRDQLAGLWEAQGGLCCYCDLPLPRDGKAVVDHDHTCCPPMMSCASCRRGLAHNNCNVIVGMANENWALLEAIAARGRVLQAAARERIAGSSQQEALPIDIKRAARQQAAANPPAWAQSAAVAPGQGSRQ